MPPVPLTVAPPNPLIVAECRTFLSERGRTYEDALAVGFTDDDIRAALAAGGGNALPKPQAYPTDHHRHGEAHPQQMFLDSEADIVIFGGAAGGGKTYGLFLEAAKDRDIPGASFVYFRRQQTDIAKQGGPWEKSMAFFSQYGANPNLTSYKWRFPGGGGGQFASLQYDHDVHNWQTAEVDLFLFDELTHFCMTPDHEVLTEHGWQVITDVGKGARVASLSDDGDIEYETVLENHTFPYDGDLVSCNQRNGVAFRVTPNHKTVVKSQSAKHEWRFVRADHLESTIQEIPRTGKWSVPDCNAPVVLPVPSGRGHGPNANNAASIPVDDYLELLGWYLSEGSAFVSGTAPRITIRQMKECTSLLSLFSRLPYRTHISKDGQHSIFSRQLYDHFKPMGSLYEKRIPRWVFGLSRRQMSIVWDAFVLGDGHIDKRVGSTNFGLANSGLIDDLQEMAFLLGYVSTRGVSVTKDGFTVYRLSVSGKRKGTQVKPHDIYREKYTGTVHCLSVAKNHTFYVRLNGRCHWTGNTEYQFWYMLSRNRSPLPTKKRLRAGTNPDGASWVKRVIAPWVDIEWDGITFAADNTPYKAEPAKSGELRYVARTVENDIIWVDKDWRYPAEKSGQRPKPKSITFIASSLDDNTKLTETDPDYISNLLMQDPINSARLLRSDWTVVSGVYFSQWNNRRHVRDVVDVPRWYTWFGGWDYGKSAPFCFLLMAADEEGNVIVVDEIYAAGVEDYDQAFRVKAMLEEYDLSLSDVIIWHDPAIGKDRTAEVAKTAVTIKPMVIRPSEVFADHGLKVKPADNDLLSGWGRVRQYLNATPEPAMPPNPLMGPYLTVSKKCRNLIRTMPTLPPDKTDETVVDTHAEDHAADALRYGLMSRPKRAINPEGTKADTYIEKMLKQLDGEGPTRGSVRGDPYAPKPPKRYTA